MTAILLKPLARKQKASLETAISRPASVGPIMRPAFWTKPFIAMAPGKSLLDGTSSETNDWRTGVSVAMTIPSSTAMTSMCQTSIRFIYASSASAMACTRASACVAISSLRRSKRSAHEPPSGAKIRIGIWLANAVSPSRNAEPVNR